MRVVTESGATYQFTKDMGKFRRLRKRNPEDPESEVERVQREEDGRWRSIFDMQAAPRVGEPMNIMVDDEEPSKITVWQTSVVVGIEQ